MKTSFTAAEALSFESNSMTKDEYMGDIKTGAKAAEAKIKALFPDFMVTSSMQKILGVELGRISFANVSSTNDAPNRIINNVVGYMTFTLDPTDSRGKLPETQTSFTIEAIQFNKRELKANGVTFRKITGKTPSEAWNKLYLWFKKNRDAIQNLPVSFS